MTNSFRRFLDDSNMEMHNIAAERMPRRIAMARRNWMHVGSHVAAENISFGDSLLPCDYKNSKSAGSKQAAA